MKVIQIESPIIGKRTGIGQAYDALLKDLLPLNAWSKKQDLINKNKKF